MSEAKWNDAWNAPNYAWPVTPAPDTDIVEALGRRAAASGGRVVKEAHADRGIVMDFPNGAAPGTRIRRQVPRCECRRRAQVVLPEVAEGPLKMCIVCDAGHLWPEAVA